MCERANEPIDVIAAILPSEMPRNVCRAFSAASGRGIKVRMLFPDKENTLDLSRLEGYFEVKLAKSIPAAGIILIDNSEFCVGGLDVPESENTRLGMWMNQPELARLARLIFDNLYDSAEKYES
jgi:sugar-specific transcriptional regulator TrmB